MAQKPGIPKGTRDFGPQEMASRNYIFNTISNVYKKFGFQQIETPAMENLSSLLGKYGEEGDKLLFKILNSGDFLSKLQDRDLSSFNSLELSTKISEKGLRYDLTVPFARYVVQHRNEIQFPFRRYQIQPVWRADRPQKGRYREFFQCDADMIGSNSLLNEVELIQIIDEVFDNLGIRVIIKINNRKILSGLSEVLGESERLTELTTAMDKLDKMSLENVIQEMKDKGISQDAIDKLKPILGLSGSLNHKLEVIKDMIGGSEAGYKGIEEIQSIFSHLERQSLRNEVELDLSLARGLNYYTGAIIEVKSKDVRLGSICGGGRYDDLTGIFGLKDVSGVGISFGADRIYDVMSELNLFPEYTRHSTQILFINFGGEEESWSFDLLKKIREAGIASEIYPDAAKIKKQMNYANARNIPWVAMAGTEERNNNKVSLKNMISGEQQLIDADKLAGHIKNESA